MCAVACTSHHRLRADHPCYAHMCRKHGPHIVSWCQLCQTVSHSPMSCGVTLWHVVSCACDTVSLCHKLSVVIVSHSVTRCYTVSTPCHIVPHLVRSCHRFIVGHHRVIVSHCVTLCRHSHVSHCSHCSHCVTLCDIVSHYVIVCHIVSHLCYICVTLYHIVSHCVTLCHIVSHCVISCHRRAARDLLHCPK